MLKLCSNSTKLQGTSVKCVDAQFVYDRHTPKEYRKIKKPKEGSTYTVRDVVNVPNYGVGIRLVEIVNPPIYHVKGGWKEPIFSIDRFEIVLKQPQ